MKIFDKRPLSLILCITLSGFVAFSVASRMLRVFLLLIPLALIGCFLFLFFKRESKNYLIIISAAALLISFLFSFIYFDVYFNPHKRYAGECEIVGTVIFSEDTSYGTSLTIRTKSINGDKYQGRKLKIYFSGTEKAVTNLGDTIKIRGDIEAFESTDSFDERAYYYSDGICAELIPSSDIEVLDNAGTPLSAIFSIARENLGRRAVMNSDDLTGTLLAALLFGERDALPKETLLDFTRIGISHILALSGMHLAIIALGITALLSFFGIKKKARTLITIIFSVLYMAFTGFSVSVMRAGFMLIITSVLFLFSRTHDSVTSLFTSVFIILIVTPYAIYDISLWLSAFSTLGIIVLYEYSDKKGENEGFIKELWKFIKYSLLSSVFAISMTLIFTVYTFNGLSLISPVSTIVFAFLAEVIMYLGTLVLILGALIPIGRLLIPLAHFTVELAAQMSRPRFIYVSTGYALIRVAVILLTVLIVAFIIFDVKNKKRFINALVSSFALVYIIAAACSLSSYGADALIYASNTRSDIFLLKSDSEICLINSSEYSKKSAKYVRDLLNEEKITDIDAYHISHYSPKMTEDIIGVIESVKTKELYLPTPKTPDEEIMLSSVFAACEEFDVDISVYIDGEPIVFGEYSLQRDYASAYGDGSLCTLFISCGDEIYAYLSSGMLSDKVDYPKYENMRDCSAVIFGSYGSKTQKDVFIDKFFDKNKTVVLSSDSVFLTQDVYSEYIKNGCKIYSHPSKIYLSDVE